MPWWFKSFSPIVLFLLCSLASFAQSSRGITDTKIAKFGSAGTLPGLPFTPFTVGGNQTLEYSANGETSKKIVNVIRFALHEETEKLLPENFTATIKVLIEYRSNPSSFIQSIIQDFDISWNKEAGAKHNPKDYFHFEDAEYVKLTILEAVQVAPASVPITELVTLENEMRITRFFTLNASVPAPNFVHYPGVATNPADQVEVGWNIPAGTGHNASQLEWTWLEDDLAPAYHAAGTTTVDIERLFADGATRIDLPYGTHLYKIPLYYDGAGKLYYRVRAVNFAENGNRTDGGWSEVKTTGYLGHNNDLNWQVRTSFAEEGKHKSVVEYYDGSLRSRQTVTKDNSTGNVVHAETLYDYEGRPAVQILPVPSMAGVIQYRTNLNLFNGQAPNTNHAEFFDLEPATPSSLTAPLTAALNGTGAAKYYSPQNDEAGTDAAKHIPDGEGYPYTATRYTPDGSGRIMAQSGVGPTHKLGSGHETKYFYGIPLQAELDGLFGTEVGYNIHYAKNMVRDANGQMSVSYVDMAGRTIATALAGDAPANLQALNTADASMYPNQNGTPITASLLDPYTNIAMDGRIESTTSLLVPVPTHYTFKYDLSPAALESQICAASATPFCADCLYDLEIAITDESGEREPLVYKFSNVSPTSPPDENCATGAPTFSQVAPYPTPPATVSGSEIQILYPAMPIGSYTIRKTLTLSEASLAQYRDRFLSRAAAECKTEQQVIDSVYNALLTTSGCDQPPVNACADCRTELGEFEAYRIAFLQSVGYPNPPTPAPPADNVPANHPIPAHLERRARELYTEAKAGCDLICGSYVPAVNTRRQLMLQDITPHEGQYASEAAPAPKPNCAGQPPTMHLKYNIFSPGSGEVGTRPFYKYPLASAPWTATPAAGFYADDNGRVDPAMHPGGESDRTLLNNLSVPAFVSAFQLSYAEALLPHHPEYKRLRFVEQELAIPSRNVYGWMQSFQSVQSWTAAQTAGYIYVSDATINDPLYTAPNTGGLRSQMGGWINSDYRGTGFSMWQLARARIKCNNLYGSASANCAAAGGQKVPPFGDVTEAEKDKLWQAFRDLYAAAREEQLNRYIALQVPLPDEEALVCQGFLLRFPSNERAVQQVDGNGYTPVGWGGSGSGSGGAGGGGGVGTPTGGGSVSNPCDAYAQRWKTQLLQCERLAAHPQKEQILNDIVTGLTAVCNKGLDAANPMGSSTVKPATPADGKDRSFEEVINRVYAAYGIQNPRNLFCNPYVIEFPKPYGKGPRLTDAVTQIIDACACDNFALLSAEASAAGVNASNLAALNAWLQAKGLQPLTAPMHAALLGCAGYTVQACNTVFVNVQAHCADPKACTNTCASRIGAKTGDNAANRVIPANCTKFTEIIRCYFDNNNSGLISPNQQGACEEAFTLHFNGWCGTQLTWNQIAVLYTQLCGKALNVCAPNCVQDVPCPTVVCGTTFQPFLLDAPQPLPEYLKCGGWPAQPRCATCDDLRNLTAEFKTKIDVPHSNGPHLTGADLDEDQMAQNGAWARFLNFRTGFQYGWMDYGQKLQAAACDPLTAGGGPGTPGVEDLMVNNRSGNTPAQYIASRSITFEVGFESGVSDAFETLLQPNGTPGGGGNGSQTVICQGGALDDPTDFFQPADPCERIKTLSVFIGQEIYQRQLQSRRRNWEAAYRARCMAAKDHERFTVSYTTREYHYTLYYYDRAGSLVKTVPPRGVHPDYSDATLAQVAAARNACRIDNNCPAIAPKTPDHSLTTDYRYNALGQVVAQKTPDAGISRFWYDKLGRLVISQNAQQEEDKKYSYTRYDPLGRIVEVGQKPYPYEITQTLTQNESELALWLGSGLREQITYTGYDAPSDLVSSEITQQNLRNRVSFTAVKASSNDNLHYTGTFYSYDVHGNVDKLLQDYRGVTAMNGSTSDRFKHMEYDYDLISGKVNEVRFNPDRLNPATGELQRNEDKGFHRYSYDAENRLTEVHTSRDRIEWERDAAYEYYKHGPLRRTELGHQLVQGVDYAYTLQGWLKGVNTTTLPSNTAGAGALLYDMGRDGQPAHAHGKVARDVYGFGLHYFDDGTNQDYKPIGGTSAFARPNNGHFLSLYNGNIGGMSVNLAGAVPPGGAGPNGAGLSDPLFYRYRYDQLNRIVSMQAYNGLQSNNTWQPIAMDAYKESVSYDPNGNILSYERNGKEGKLDMDNMTYGYNTTAEGKLLDNRLNHVKDAIGDAAYEEDIDGQGEEHYRYDAIGNLISENYDKFGATLLRPEKEGIRITWNVYGKILSVQKSNGVTINYSYDASGNRIAKTVDGITTVYVRDASGNVMGVYTHKPGNAPVQTEWHLYGSSRLGLQGERTVASQTITMADGINKGRKVIFTRGEKFFELSNHLGNVLVTVSDRKLQNTSDNQTVAYYMADVASATDYYPFGMIMPGRKYNGASGYRYGFNGKERDTEASSTTTYDYGFRIYNPALGKFLSVDPLTKSYPHYTPYQFAGNKPVMAIDLDGLEEWVAIFVNGKPTTFRFAPELKPLGANQIYKQTFYFPGGGGPEGLSIYNVNTKATVNVAFIPDETLVQKDVDEHTRWTSAYKIDAEFFGNLDSKSANFAAIGISSLKDMAFEGALYAIEHDVAINDVIIDFHGTQHGNADRRFDGDQHRLSIGSDRLEVNAEGVPVNYDANTQRFFQLIGKFTIEGSETLLGACNADKCVEVMKFMGRDMNSTIYGHKSYSYSTNLQNGTFYGGGDAWVLSRVVDGNSANQGKYVQVTPRGLVTHVDGVGFGTGRQSAGEVSKIPVKKD